MAKPIDLRKTRKTLFSLLKPEAGFFWVAIAYGVAISLMTLAVPIAVQTLINSIANIGSTRAVIILAVILFLTLFLRSVDLILLNNKSNEFSKSILPPTSKKNRVDIYDRNNVLLATNVKSASIYAKNIGLYMYRDGSQAPDNRPSDVWADQSGDKMMNSMILLGVCTGVISVD